MQSPALAPKRRFSAIVSLICIVVGSVAFARVAGHKASTFLDSAPRLERSESTVSATHANYARASKTISATAGSGQTTSINTPFSIQLQATVTESGEPQAGIDVTFTAPATGASGTFSGGASTVTVSTGVDGVAISPELTANDTAGSFGVQASIADGSTTFSLINAKGDQALTFDALPERVFGDPAFTISATSSSGLPIAFSIVSGPANTSGDTLTITGVGTVTVRAAQDGNENYNAAIPIDQSFAVAKADQTITFDPLGNKTYGDPDFELNATSSSGLNLTVTTIGHCTVSGLTVHLTGSGSCTLIASQSGNSNFNPAATISQSFFVGDTGETLFDLMTYGAAGDGTADDGPALKRALQAVADAGGGTVIVPPGRYAIITPVAQDFTGLASSITMRGLESDKQIDVTAEGAVLAEGLGLTAEFLPKTGQQAALYISGVQKLLIADIAFVGTPGIFNDAVVTLGVSKVENATVRHCEFYGLSANGGAIVHATASGLSIEQTKFLGSFGSSGTDTPNVQNLQWKSIALTDVVFIDYGLRPGLWGKGNFAATLSWVNIGNAAPVTPDSPRREAVFRQVFLDEGGYFGLTSLPGRYQPPSAPIDLLYISGLRMNVSNFGTTGHHLTGLMRVMIEKSHYSWSHNADSAMHFFGPGEVILDEIECIAQADRIRADSAIGKLTIINSIYGDLASAAQTTRVITTATPEDDPVQYVRQRFENIVGRAPDAAAHYYWSDLMLQCEEDVQCVEARSEELIAYLNTQPLPNFSISGRVTDEDGEPRPGVLMTLSGSQSVTTQTGNDGRYSFAGLPTSGVYNVTPSLPHYAFNAASRTIITPGDNQTLDFVTLINHYEITGQLRNAAGQAIAGATIELSGSQTGTTTTDSAGNYSFSAPALGDYTITPAKAHHTFSPASLTHTVLSEDQQANFLATPVKYTLSGRVTSAGLPISGVTVTVSGSGSAVAMTDAAGNYSLAMTAEGNYIVRSTLSNYSFAPSELNYTYLAGNRSGDFVATLNRHSICGRVTGTNGAAVSGAAVSLGGAQTGTTLTDVAGNYAFPNLPAGKDYSVTITKQNYSFSPGTRTFNGISSDQIGNFSGSLLSYTISGQVTGEGEALDGAVVTLSGSQSGTTTTNSSGSYSFTVTAEGNYTVAVSKTHYAFSPQSLNFTSLSRNEAANFSGTLDQHAISGQITSENGAGIKSVTIALSGGESRLTMTDANGNFNFPNLAAGETYAVTPSLDGYEFTPLGKMFTNLSTDQSVSFVGFVLPQLLLDETGPDPERAVALESLLLVRDPFRVQSVGDWLNLGSNQNTRLIIFAANLNLNPSEGPSAVVIKLVDGNGQNHEVFAEDVRLVPNSSIAQITFRLPDGLAAGTCAISIRFHSLNSNAGTVSISP